MDDMTGIVETTRAHLRDLRDGKTTYERVQTYLNELVQFEKESVPHRAAVAVSWKMACTVVPEFARFSDDIMASKMKLVYAAPFREPWFMVHFADLLQDTKEYARANEILGTIPQDSDDYISAQFKMGINNEYLRNDQAALSNYEVVLSLDPTHQLALKGAKRCQDAMKPRKKLFGIF